MKALTLWQPWASLVALGEKKIETRGWQTAYRGPLAIHAAQKMTHEMKLLCEREPFASALDRVFAAGDELPLGAIVAVCELNGVLEIKRAATSDTPLLVIAPDKFRIVVSEPERSFGDYTPGRYAWMLSNVRRLPEPIPCRGAQQLWEVDGYALRQISAQKEILK